MLNFKQWIKKSKNKIFSIYTKIENYTPFEIANKFEDESKFEYQGDYYIVESILLPDNDILLGCRCCYEELDESQTLYLEQSMKIEYFKLSKILFHDITKKYAELEVRYEK